MSDIRESIRKAREALEKGLIADPEAASQLRRMIVYYEAQLKAEEEENSNG